jgi:hypothetical protein
MPETLSVMTEIDMRRVADLLCSAFEGGVGYWCQIINYREPTTVVLHLGDAVCKYADYPLCADGAVICRDIEDDKRQPMLLDLEAIKRGLALMPKVAPRHWGDFLSENDDASTGDVFVQLCLLGEIVYG